MTRRDYVKLAAAFAAEKPVQRDRIEQWKRDVFAVADVLFYDNPRFDRGRFLEASGISGKQPLQLAGLTKGQPLEPFVEHF